MVETQDGMSEQEVVRVGIKPLGFTPYTPSYIR